MTRADAEEAIREILKEFLDDTDYVLEAPIEQADDEDFYDQPYTEATTALLDLLDRYCEGARISEAIERLDVQCAEGKCSNCDSKRGRLRQLQDELAALKPKSEETK